MKTPEFTFEASFNSDGLRDREFGAKDSNVFRILFLGDSFTYAYVDLNSAFHKLIERELNEQHGFGKTRFETVNAGMLTFGTMHEYWLLNRIGLC